MEIAIDIAIGSPNRSLRSTRVEFDLLRHLHCASSIGIPITIAKASLNRAPFTFDGRVVSFVVRLMHTFSGEEKCVVSGEEKCVARYDTAHGCPHLDIVDGKGRLLEKKWLLGMGLAEALLFAVKEFKDGYKDYIKDFRA